MDKIRFVATMFLGFFVFLGCSNESEQVEALNAATAEVKAIIKPNGLAYDGCDTHIQIEQNGEMVMYVPTSSSKNLVDNIVKAEQSTLAQGEMLFKPIPVLINYKLTGKKGELLCGWGKKSTLDEIEISKISKIQ